MHRLHRDATRFVNGHHVKDLSRLNRNVKKIVLVDDDAHAAMLQPANLIRVAPYSDARDKSDKQLLELIPFLTSIVKEGVDDVPKLLSSYGSHDASSILRSYRAQVDAIRQGQDAVRAKGIGARRARKAPDAPPPPKVRARSCRARTSSATTPRCPTQRPRAKGAHVRRRLASEHSRGARQAGGAHPRDGGEGAAATGQQRRLGPPGGALSATEACGSAALGEGRRSARARLGGRRAPRDERGSTSPGARTRMRARALGRLLPHLAHAYGLRAAGGPSATTPPRRRRAVTTSDASARTRRSSARARRSPRRRAPRSQHGGFQNACLRRAATARKRTRPR